MSIDIVKRWGVFFVLLLVQGLVCNHIHLFHCATPLLYIMFVLHFRRNTPRWQMLLWSFALGLGVDIFANTPGVAAGSMTAIALLQPYLLELFLPRDSSDDLLPGVRTLGSSYFWYSLIIVVIYCLLFFQFLQLVAVDRMYRGKCCSHLCVADGHRECAQVVFPFRLLPTKLTENESYSMHA